MNNLLGQISKSVKEIIQNIDVMRRIDYWLEVVRWKKTRQIFLYFDTGDKSVSQYLNEKFKEHGWDVRARKLYKQDKIEVRRYA